ncbi:unnamed protein product [Prunus brigantina]
MGNICASSQFISEGAKLIRPSTTKIVQLDGGLQELRRPVVSSHILSQNPNCFLCTSESMYVGSCAPQVPKDEELQLGQIYFLMPLSQSKSPLSLQDLCSLAIKAGAALANHSEAAHLVSSKRSPTGVDMVGMMSSKEGRGNQRIEL